jgi:hypothetical protein
MTILLLLAVLVVALLVWVVDLCCCRKSINEAELNEGLQWRQRSKILQPKQENGGARHVYPLCTNLCREDIAGPGMALHFNFQVFVIMWALFVAVTWSVLALFHDDLWILGTRRFGTPRHNCILVAWGYETQQRLMWTKVLFLAIVYIVTFIACLVFAIYQYRLYTKMDAGDKTYKDFAVELKGLPKLPADHKEVENVILDAVFRATGLKAVGASVGWDFSECQDEVMQAVEESRGIMSARTEELYNAPPAELGATRKKMYEMESWLFGPGEEKSVQPKNLLKKMTSSDCAYVVFSTEDQKDQVLRTTRGIMFDPRACLPGAEECCLTVERVPCEPAAINWKYFGDTSPRIMTNRLLWNFCTLYVPALAVWFFVFYVPYALSLYHFNYENGAELPGYYGLIFTMVVVGGNATMYIICDMCAEQMRFRYKDTKQVAYVLMYLFACTINVLLDMVVTYVTAKKIMVGLDFRTYDGRRLSDIDSFTEQFETYAMQRTLAENTYAYAFPSTFLIPFLLEPFVTILVPLWIAEVLIRTHRDIRGKDAEGWIAAADFDLGRYADILLNVFLGILIFYFPGGYTWRLFFGMFFSHIVIYLFDHCRVLNVIPYVKCVSYEVDWWAQFMLIPCCSLIVSCLVFKANCEPYVGYCLKDVALISVTTLTGVAHFIVHLLLFLYLVPALGGIEVEAKSKHLEYKDVAVRDAHSWFAVNPVHCLRSQYIHEDEPYCRFASVGKEHLLEINEDIGCYFKDEPAETQEFGIRELSRKGLFFS